MNETKNQFSTKTKWFHSDRETKYYSNLYNEFYKQQGIFHETTTQFFLEMNGKV